MGTTTTTISLDRFRRTRHTSAPEAAGVGVAPAAHPLVGAALGTLERRYGLMLSEDTIVVAEVVATSGDLAVADRLAFVASMERHTPVVVIEFDGWYVACTTERTMAPGEVAQLRPVDGAPRIMSLVTERGMLVA